METQFRRFAVFVNQAGTFHLTCLAIAGIAVLGIGGYALGHILAPANDPAAVEHLASTPAPLLPSSDAHVSALGRLPAILSAADRTAYIRVFAAQRRGDWTAADLALKTASNPLLRGHVLADRYLHRKYTSSYPELTAWLERYRDQPDAQALYDLALNKKPAGTWLRLRMEPSHRLKGYGEESSAIATGLDDNGLWQEGLNAWRVKNYALAAERFMHLSSYPKKLSSTDRSAVNYWAWRALTRVGNETAAKRYLAAAAKESRTFYGILARKQRAESLELARMPKALSKETTEALYQNAALQRIVALVEIGLHDRAEAEMRELFPVSPASMQKQLIVVASELGLSAVQIRMAQILGPNGAGYDYALYPRPALIPRTGFEVAPELIFAFARAESGFHMKAESTAGALGMMQIMPDTASYIAKKTNIDLDTIAPKGAFRSAEHAYSEPVMNMTLGQSYIRYLMEQPNVRGNLFYLAAAYNAGPGKLAEWRRSMAKNDDPLLFVESVPYSETRRYITQVMTSYWIYREMDDQEATTASMVAKDQWPVYDGLGDVALLSR